MIKFIQLSQFGNVGPLVAEFDILGVFAAFHTKGLMALVSTVYSVKKKSFSQKLSSSKKFTNKK